MSRLLRAPCALVPREENHRRGGQRVRSCLGILWPSGGVRNLQGRAEHDTMHHIASHHSPVSMPGTWANWPACSSVLLGLRLEELSNGTTELHRGLLLEMSRLGSGLAGKGPPWMEISQGRV